MIAWTAFGGIYKPGPPKLTSIYPRIPSQIATDGPRSIGFAVYLRSRYLAVSYLLLYQNLSPFRHTAKMEAFTEAVGGALFQLRQHALQFLLGIASLFNVVPLYTSNYSQRAACFALRERTDFVNATILDVHYFGRAIDSVPTLGVCLPSASIPTPLCRVQFTINTSESSLVTAEAWLPDTWYGRFLALGNGGLDGCKY